MTKTRQYNLKGNSPCCAVTQALAYRLYVRQSTRAECAGLSVVGGKPGIPGVCCYKRGGGGAGGGERVILVRRRGTEKVRVRGGSPGQIDSCRVSVPEVAEDLSCPASYTNKSGLSVPERETP